MSAPEDSRAASEGLLGAPTSDQQAIQPVEHEMVDEREAMRLLRDEAMSLPDTGIALSGISGRFPKCDTMNEFEHALRNGADLINDEDCSRFPCRLWGLPPRAGRLNDLSKFDHEFFGYTQDAANQVDFQLRILLEVVYESILDSGLSPSELRGTNTGVYLGLHCNEFESAMALDTSFKTVGGYFTQYAPKVAQIFDLRGTVASYDAACASGFVGLHCAVEALRAGTIERAIVCSVNIPIHPVGNFVFYQMQMLSPTGYSRFLDSKADGYVKSESCVSMVLEKKHIARRQYCTFMATMSSVDGYKKEGITFPSDTSQESLIRATKEAALLSTNHIEYLEAHGTGTPAGDPQEAIAFSNVYYPKHNSAESNRLAKLGERRLIGPLLAGSVKTNMGHSEGVSGLCALAKVMLMLENETIYPSLHYEAPNYNIESLIEGRIKFTKETSTLRAKIVPLSCYGFGGANVHVIVRASELPSLDEASQLVVSPAALKTDRRLVVMFGRSKAGLEAFFDDLLNIEQAPEKRHCLSDDYLSLLNSINSHKIDRLMNQRGYLLVERNVDGNLGESRELARSIGRIELQPLGVEGSHPQDSKPRKCNLVYPGLGAEWPQMGAGLKDTGTGFWSSIGRLAGHLIEASSKLDLIKLLDGRQLQDTMARKFVSIVGWQIAATNLIRQRLQLNHCEHTLGHSLGSISSLYSAGALTEQEAILVAYNIGNTLDSLVDSKCAGKLVAVRMGEHQFEQDFAQVGGPSSTVRVSCVNGQESITVSGSNKDIESLCTQLEAKQVDFKHLDSPIAMHNNCLMGADAEAKIRSSLQHVLAGSRKARDGSPSYVSCLSSSRASELRHQANADYFAHSMCNKVDFAKAVGDLGEDSICLEMGPSGLFESQLRFVASTHSKGSNKFHYAKLMAKDTCPEQQEIKLLSSIGDLYIKGASMDLSKLVVDSADNSNQAQTQSQVRRQTPSISSLLRWDHKSELFVPKYPQHFSKSSAKSSFPIDLMQERDKYLSGHCIEGRVLFPATGYLFLVWKIFSFTIGRVYDAAFHTGQDELVPVEFTNVRLTRAVILGQKVEQLYFHYEEATGYFEVKEGGSVCVEGYVSLPTEKPDGLQYEHIKAKIKSENLELEMNADDVYKQFRLSGYDYGETFRNIVASSADGRYTQVKYNEHFIAFSDCILQSVFLAVQQYAPSGGLFLPTRFDYLRIQPEIIKAKLAETGHKFDLGDGTLDTKAKRDIMNKILEREEAPVTEAEAEEAKKEDEARKKEQEQLASRPECLFDAYCDPLTGIIISDGIEMRGVKATPAPRRTDGGHEVLMESYGFVQDDELPIVGDLVAKREQATSKYIQICDSMSIKLLETMCQTKLDLSSLDGCEPSRLANQEQIEAYKSAHLSQLYKQQTKEAAPAVQQVAAEPNKTEPKPDEYDIKKNGAKTLLSVLDQLADVGEPQQVKQVVSDNRQHLMNDLIQQSVLTERFMRPMAETILENVCKRKAKLQLIEINVDDGVIVEPLSRLLQQIEPQLTLDYSLAHPDIARLPGSKLTLANSEQQVKTHNMTDLSSLYNEKKLKDFDLVVYKDISCYSLPKQVIEKNGLRPVLGTLNNIVHKDGFIMVILREKLSLAERVLLALSEPELVGLGKQDLEQLAASGTASKSAQIKINSINSILASRCELMQEEAKRNKMICAARRSDNNGCLALLFKTSIVSDNTTSAEKAAQTKPIERVLLRVDHEDETAIKAWLEPLKDHFKKPPVAEEPAKPGETDKPKEPAEAAKPAATSEVTPEPNVEKVFWLCAVATRERPINGLIGMMQALRKELGSNNLRCYYDAHTFRNQSEPISISDIKKCSKFKQALERDLIWNCIDEKGNFGAYRHFTINDFLSYENCLCADQSPEESEQDLSLVAKPAFASNAIRGDLSTFTWFEAPYKHLGADDAHRLVRVAYAALNFRDVMTSTGRLPLDALPLKVAMSDCLLGLEFSGLDANNKRVMGMLPSRGIANQVFCSELTSVTVEVPDWMTLKEAATIPVVYTTAFLAMVHRGRMRRGESILIHAGSGGVGQAAIRLATHFGLDIYTTVGSPEKRKFLLEEFPNSLDEGRIFSSRDCTFEEQIMRATRGRGVDMVLNSLADDKLQASIRCLADGGRFLEIGKYDLSVDSKLELLKLDTNKSFHGILLDKLFDCESLQDKFRMQTCEMVHMLMDGLTKGYVKPIKHTVFKSNQIEDAFRYMATGKHIGKVLVQISDQLESKQRKPQPQAPLMAVRCVPRFQLSPDKSYIVTGGLGGFGLELCKWLVGQGARNLLLTSRTGCRTGYQKVTVRRLETTHKCRVRVVTLEDADTTSLAGCMQLCDLARNWAPNKQVGGIFHLAMVLKDTLLENMSHADFELVCEPKLRTCQHLEALTRTGQPFGEHLDYFVCFSSVTSGKGNAGQSNYAYANSYLERVCEKRRARGQHGLAIQWGAIGDVGVAFENLGGNDVVVGGTVPQRMPSCQATLAKLLASPFSTCLSVVPVNRGATGAGAKGDLVAAIFHVLGIKDSSKVSEQATLGELGLDSLMAVEVRQYIEREYEVSMNMQEIRALTIAKIREIGENGKPTKQDSAADDATGGPAAPTTRVVDNYGTAAGAKGDPGAAFEAKMKRSAGAAIEQMLEKSNIGEFTPQLRMPRRDFIRLNNNNNSNGSLGSKPLNVNGSQLESSSGGPVFFIPPIHGSFRQLAPICANIKRPCIGLHWTRKLGRAKTVAEAVELLLEVLEKANWEADYCGNSRAERPTNGKRTPKVVDLIGYSFGATIAFELMLAIQKKADKRNSKLGNGNGNGNGNGGAKLNLLAPGRLIMLDGSPKHFEISKTMMVGLDKETKMDLSEKVDEMLLGYMHLHTKGIEVDYLKLKQQLSERNLDAKIELASQKLASLLETKLNGVENTNGKDNNIRDEDDDESSDDCDDYHEAKSGRRLEPKKIADAMEAFCRRYEIIHNYEVTDKLAADCMLIRAQKSYLNDSKAPDDLGLSEVVEGKVELKTMSGNHESFLSENYIEISGFITATCN